MAMLSVTQRALMHVAQPVAASEKGAVMFLTTLSCMNKQRMMEITSTLSEDIDKLVGHDLKLLMLMLSNGQKFEQVIFSNIKMIYRIMK